MGKKVSIVANAWNSSTWGLREKELEFKASLGFITRQGQGRKKRRQAGREEGRKK
jgi:hypothetical protein